MLYSDYEITREYRNAKDKKEQLKILAQLNACPIDHIIKVLTLNGYEYDSKKGEYVMTRKAVQIKPVMSSEVKRKPGRPKKTETISTLIMRTSAENLSAEKSDCTKDKSKLGRPTGSEKIATMLDQKVKELRDLAAQLRDKATALEHDADTIEATKGILTEDYGSLMDIVKSEAGIK